MRTTGSMLVLGFLVSVVVLVLGFLVSVVVLVLGFLVSVVALVLGAFGSLVMVTASAMHMAGVVVDREFRGVGHRGQKAK